LPFRFEQNQGQTHSRVRFLSRGSDLTLYLTDDALTLSIVHDEPLVTHVSMAFVGGNSAVNISGVGEIGGLSHYFTHSTPGAQAISAPTYSKVRYQSVYPGVDVIVYGQGRQLEYDFVVAP